MNKVYVISLENLKKSFSFEELYNVVSTYRKEKVDRLKFEKDKYLSLGVEYLLKYALENENINYSKIEIGFKENKKPMIKNYKGIFFNLSHSDEMMVCAISDKEIGCDVQRKKKDILDIVDRFFGDNEKELIYSSSDKNTMFNRFWTLKESYIKALGTGLGTGLNEFHISLRDDKIEVKSNKELDTDFYFEEIDIGSDEYNLAICSKSFEKANVIIIK